VGRLEIVGNGLKDFWIFVREYRVTTFREVKEYARGS